MVTGRKMKIDTAQRTFGDERWVRKRDQDSWLRRTINDVRIACLKRVVDHAPLTLVTGASDNHGEPLLRFLRSALDQEPQLILVDEPTAQLDAEMASTVNGVLRSLSNEGAIVVVATHDAATAGVCDRAIDLGKDRMSVPREPL